MHFDNDAISLVLYKGQEEFKYDNESFRRHDARHSSSADSDQIGSDEWDMTFHLHKGPRHHAISILRFHP